MSRVSKEKPKDVIWYNAHCKNPPGAEWVWVPLILVFSKWHSILFPLPVGSSSSNRVMTLNVRRSDPIPMSTLTKHMVLLGDKSTTRFCFLWLLLIPRRWKNPSFSPCSDVSVCCVSEIVWSGVSSSEHLSSDRISEIINTLALKRRCIPCLNFYGFNVYVMLVKHLFRRRRNRKYRGAKQQSNYHFLTHFVKCYHNPWS